MSEGMVVMGGMMNSMEMEMEGSSGDGSGNKKMQKTMAGATQQQKAPDLKPMMSSSSASAISGRTGAVTRGANFGTGRTGSFGAGRTGGLR